MPPGWGGQGPVSRRVAYVRTVKTASGATAVQVVWSWRRGSRSIEHVGSAHDEVELAALKAAAAARLAAGQTELDLGLSDGLEPGTLPITSFVDDPSVGRIVYSLPGTEVRVGNQGRQRISRSRTRTDHRTDQQDRSGPGAE